MFSIFILQLLLMLSLVACSKTQQMEPPGDSADGHPHDEFLRDSARFSDGKTRMALDVTSYALHAKFDWETSRLYAVVDIRLARPEGDKLELDSNISRVVSVSLLGGAPLTHSVDPKEGRLMISLSGIASDPELAIRIQYEVDANSARVRLRSSALQAVLPRAGDPIQARVVSTFSEPEGASYWLPCHDVPSDRARFSAEFVMPAGERLISNGDLELDELVGSERRMKYSTRYTIPTYLMAFSQGEFEVSTRYHGGLPVSYWVRKGLPVDSEGMLDSIVGFIKTFEGLMGPYPFEKYATILLPEYSGGIEHAGITFQGETSSTQSRFSADLGLTAHELAHQWFGDYVTVATWDDLWIKEGMATLLAEEATRYFEDTDQSGRLFGSYFGVAAGDAIRDPALAPDDKYTSGPYGRAAWLHTQIRSKVGEARYWSLIKTLLRDHAFGAIGTADFLAYFRPSLGETAFDSVQRALSAKSLPEFKLDEGVLTLNDPDGAIVNPVEYRLYNASGGYVQGVLSSAPVSLAGGSLLAIDPTDQHAITSFEMKEGVFEQLLPYLVPSEATLDLFSKLPSHQTDLAIDPRANWKLEPESFGALYGALSSEEVKYEALQLACRLAKDSQKAAEWRSVLEPHFLRPPYLGLPARAADLGFSGCEGIIGDLFYPRLERLKHSPDDRHFDEVELVLLASVPAKSSVAFSAWTRVVERGRSVRARVLGLNALSRYLRKLGSFALPEATEGWTGFLHSTLELAEPSEIQGVALQITRDIGDKSALRSIAKVARRAFHPRVQRQSICTARALTETDLPAWTEFVKNLGDLSQLPFLIQELVQDPKRCN